MTCILQCVPRQLQQQALLWIHAACLQGRDPKERRIELIHCLDTTLSMEGCANSNVGSKLRPRSSLKPADNSMANLESMPYANSG
jgi:hypothetical protein